MSSNRFEKQNRPPRPNPESVTSGHTSTRHDDHLFNELCSVNNELVNGCREMFRRKSEMVAGQIKREARDQDESKEANN